jgi:hypothetical protein
MFEHAIRQAMRRVGTRADALGTCPICGKHVRSDDERVRAWPGKFAHNRCASYQRGRAHSQRVHDSFTAT